MRVWKKKGMGKGRGGMVGVLAIALYHIITNNL